MENPHGSVINVELIHRFINKYHVFVATGNAILCAGLCRTEIYLIQRNNYSQEYQTMSKYFYFAAAVSVLLMGLALKILYSENQKLQSENTSLSIENKNLGVVNASLNNTIKNQIDTQSSIDKTLIEISKLSDQIDAGTRKTQQAIKNQIRGLPCYDQAIPDSAIDAVCVMQPSNAICANRDKSKGSNSAGVDAAKAETD